MTPHDARQLKSFEQRAREELEFVMAQLRVQ
jgi:hypothetical protein